MISVFKTPKEEFIQLMTENCRVNGLDEISSEVIALLYANPDEISLEELSKKTGYSLSAVCTTTKLIEKTGLIKKIKKPGSRKAYFYMEKDMSIFSLDLIKRKYEKIIIPTKNKLPDIIKKYKKEKSNKSKHELKIIENYYKEVLFSEDIIKNIIKMVKKAREKIGK
jgi:DNA-binding transcriptional regulator GbsR (MarR family)